MTDPRFVGALLLLVVNDHLLKGAGLLPAALTGKLSDFAGLFVAPLVLAWLVGARGRRAVIGCHLAVGVGFALLQVPAAAAIVEGLSGLSITPDPTDLIALVALPASYRVLSFERPRRGARHALVGSVALLACAASFPTAPAPRYPYPPGGVFETDVVLRHVDSTPLEVELSRVDEDSQLDCEALMSSPQTLQGVSFGEAQPWRLERGDALPLWDRRGGGAVDRDCYAVRLTDRTHGAVWVLAWRHGTPPMHDARIRLPQNEPAEPESVRLVDATTPPETPAGVVASRAP